MLENYECSEGYFPLIWNTQKMPAIYLGTLKRFNIENLYWKSNDEAEKKVIADYVFIHMESKQPSDTNTTIIKSNLDEFYSLVCKENSCSLYKNRNLPDYHDAN
jgi:hypothetical protein